MIDFTKIRFLKDVYQVMATGREAFSDTWPANLIFQHAVSGWQWYEGCKKCSFFVLHEAVTIPLYLFQKLFFCQTGSEKMAQKISGSLVEGRYFSSKITAILGKIFDLITSLFGILIPKEWKDYFCQESRELAKRQAAKVITPLIDRIFYFSARQVYSSLFDWAAWSALTLGLLKGGVQIQKYALENHYPVEPRQIYQVAGIVYGISFLSLFIYRLYAGRVQRDERRENIQKYSDVVLKDERTKLLSFLDQKLREHSIYLSQARIANIFQFVTDATLDKALQLA